MMIRRGDVVYLRRTTPCPNAIRPYVIVSNDTGNKHADFCVGVPISMRKKRGQPTQCVVSYNDSTVMTEQVCVIKKDDIEKVLFTLNESDMKKIEKCLAVSLNLGCDEVV